MRTSSDPFCCTLTPWAYVRLHEALGIEVEPAAGPASEMTAGDAAGQARASAAAEGGAGEASRLRLHAVRSPLLRQLLAAAADMRVAATAQRMLAAMDLQAAEANDRMRVLKCAGPG